MENSIYIGLSRQMALSRDMEIISNNIANLSTPGYRGQNLVFEEYLSDPKGTDDPLSFVNDRGQYEITTPGSVRSTSNPLDVALNGPGFMGVLTEEGETVYTRAGDFTMDANGNLLTSAGYSVAGNGGGGITIPANSTEIKIDENGYISNQDGQVGQIMMVEFEDLQELQPLGNNTYATNAAPMDPQNTSMKQGYLEGSNVQPVLEMSRMIEVSRTFQQLQQTLQGEHERLRNAIQKLLAS